MTSLADMPPAQRLECVGMWCDYDASDDENPDLHGVGIIYRDVSDGDEPIFAIKDPHLFGEVIAPAVYITPRYDLPRAWTPQGNPMPGRWEEGAAEFFDWVDDSSEYGGWGESGLIFNEDGEPCGEPLDYEEWAKKVTEVARTGSGIEGRTRRFVTDWEPHRVN
ncbi:hypothetical protein [Corynebacterium ulcerans]|uniref:hypothetical protein n=2 Tax=Corynebacterium ulcerans TaxID=65058 RepID=UPI000DFCF449|nr:hypothetical protein [Corynebacterium ulcerans]STC82277.1 Uncharacterised protein [Corynebacterium ulcerans]